MGILNNLFRAGGGLIHLFRPIDLLNCEQNQAIEKLHHSLK